MANFVCAKLCSKGNSGNGSCTGLIRQDDLGGGAKALIVRIPVLILEVMAVHSRVHVNNPRQPQGSCDVPKARFAERHICCLARKSYLGPRREQIAAQPNDLKTVFVQPRDTCISTRTVPLCCALVSTAESFSLGRWANATTWVP